MVAAFFAIAGTLVGILGSVLTALVRARQEERKAWRETLRNVSSSFSGEITRLRNTSVRLRVHPDDKDLQQVAQDAHSKARGLQEQLRLVSRSRATQEAGRWLIHNAYYHWQATQGGPGDFQEARKGLELWLSKFYIEVRKELGLNGSGLYEDPEGGLPIPRAREITN